jgi:hypothetical protein
MKILLLAVALFSLPSVALAAVNTPSNLAISPGKYTNDTTPTLSWSAPSGATWYEVSIDGYGYSSIGNVLNYTLPTQTNGWHTFYVKAHDNSGAVSSNNQLTFEIDTVGPTVSQIATTSVVSGVASTITVTASGEATVTACSLMVNNTGVASMTMNGVTWSVDYVFTGSANSTVRAYVDCADGDNNSEHGASRTITITSNTPAEASAGDRIKTACGSNAKKSDACRSVYYLGSDGKRHSFPSEAVYSTWFSNWSGIKTVSSSFMSGLTLGKNVTFRPGTTLVKFRSMNDVYAISQGAVLHHYLTEALVTADYGSNWQSYLQTISDVYRGNYTTGNEIDQSTDYDAATAKAAVTSIDGNW